MPGATRCLIVSNTVTSFGSSVTVFALPLVALSTLHTSSAMVAALYATSFASAALAGLPAGAWIDGANKKRVVVLSQITGALIAFCVPAAAALGVLSTGLLFFVAVVAGLTATVVQVGTQALLPLFVEKERMVSANASLVFGRSLGTMAGPGAGGAIAGLLGSGNALMLDGAGQLVSAALLLCLLPPTRACKKVQRGRSTVRHGIRVVVRDPVLVRMLFGTAVFSVGGGLIGSLYFAFGYQELSLTPARIGIAVMTGNAGLLIGGIAAKHVIDRLGIGRAATITITCAVASFVLIPLARHGVPQLMLTGYELIFGLNISVFRVCVATLRQQRTSVDLQGRVFSVMLVGQTFGAPLGALVAATLATSPLGVSGAIVVGIIIGGLGAAVYWLPGRGAWLTGSAAR
ncbi:MFS transporter [Amycolatopsis sp. NPDC054798]